MKMAIAVIAMLLVSGTIAFAVSNHSNGNGAGEQFDQNMTSTNDSDDDGLSNVSMKGNKTNNGIGQVLSAQIREAKEALRAGNYSGPQGQLLQVSVLAHNLIALRVDNTTAETDLNITAETDSEGNSTLMANMSNGRNREIKIMPDRAAQRALDALKLKVCSPDNNCTIQLKKTGSAVNETLKYEMQVERHSRILGIFEAKMLQRAEIDAETGNVTSVQKPWWAFLATEEPE